MDGGMSDIILWYILIIGKAYLEAGLFVFIVFMIINWIFPSEEGFTWKDFFIIVFFHPIVVYHFIKEFYGDK
jgi:hypothetical protein